MSNSNTSDYVAVSPGLLQAIVSQSSPTASSNAEFAVYRALYDYTPEPEDLTDGYIAIKSNDFLQVKRPVELDSGTEQKPGGKFSLSRQFFFFGGGFQRCLKNDSFFFHVYRTSVNNSEDRIAFFQKV
jgi:hypothetical protein